MLLLFSGLLYAQTGSLDPSIFDGTGREQEAAPPEESGGSAVTEMPDAGTDEAAPPASAPGMESEAGEPAALPPAPTSEPEEIVLPGSEETDEASAPEVLDEPGIPSGSGAGPSRAGEQVESSEKIAPGQAVDYPWDI